METLSLDRLSGGTIYVPDDLNFFGQTLRYLDLMLTPRRGMTPNIAVDVINGVERLQLDQRDLAADCIMHPGGPNSQRIAGLMCGTYTNRTSSPLPPTPSGPSTVITGRLC